MPKSPSRELVLLQQIHTIGSTFGLQNPSRDGGNEDPKPTGLRHPEHLPKVEVMRLYDVRQRLQVRRGVLETSKLAGEQLPALKPLPLPGLTAKQRRSSLSNPKDEKRDLENQKFEDSDLTYQARY